MLYEFVHYTKNIMKKQITESEKQETIRAAISLGFILIPDECYDNYTPAQAYLKLTHQQRAELNAMCGK